MSLTAILFLVGAWLLGAGLARRALGRVLVGAEQALCGLVAGWMLATLAAYAIARLQGRLDWRTLAATAAALWVAATTLLWPALKRLNSRRGAWARSLWQPEHRYLLLLLALFAPVYLYLFHTHMLAEGPEGVYSQGSCWGDLGFHMAVTTSFLYGENFPPAYTLYPPDRLAYPYMPDFLTAVLAALGMSFRAALVSTGVVLSLAATGLMYTFALRVVRFQTEDAETLSSAARGAHASAAVATLLFLLNGGLGFAYLYEDWRASGRGLVDFLSTLTTSYTNMGARHIQWTNLITDTFLPQRTSLFGVPVALMIFTLFAVAWREWTRDDGDARRVRVRALAAAGVLAGCLPLFHTHSYVAVGLVSGFLFLLRPRREWLAFWLPAILIALPHFAGIAGHVTGQGFMRWQPGWRGPAEQYWLVYWFRNIGLPLLLVVPAWCAAPREWRKFYLAFVGLKLVSLFVVFTPNDYDNIKLLFYWYAATCVLIGAWLVRLATVRRQRLLAVLLAFLCTASGLLSVWQEGLHRTLFMSRAEMAAARFVREQTSPRSLFLAAPALHQPVVSLAGRTVLRGFVAWLWSHGHPLAERESDVRAIYTGRDDAAELLEFYGVDYVYLGPREREMFAADDAFFEQRFPAILRTEGINIYDVRGTRAGEVERRINAPYPTRELASRVGKDPYALVVEFPRVGFALYRYYVVAFGRAPRYAEFMEDMRALGRGLYVGEAGSNEVLERNKQALTDAWPVWRDEFKTLHASRTDAEYVAALYANAGITPEGGQRDALVSDLAAGRDSRGGALRRVAESRELFRRDYHLAYVLVHYFGYLRRAPGDAPDTNLDGFNFWRGELDRTGDYRHVTLAFVESGEYVEQGKRRK